MGISQSKYVTLFFATLILACSVHALADDHDDMNPTNQNILNEASGTRTVNESADAFQGAALPKHYWTVEAEGTCVQPCRYGGGRSGKAYNYERTSIVRASGGPICWQSPGKAVTDANARLSTNCTSDPPACDRALYHRKNGEPVVRDSFVTSTQKGNPCD